MKLAKVAYALLSGLSDSSRHELDKILLLKRWRGGQNKYKLAVKICVFKQALASYNHLVQTLMATVLQRISDMLLTSVSGAGVVHIPAITVTHLDD